MSSSNESLTNESSNNKNTYENIMDNYVSPVFQGFVNAGNGFVDMITDRMSTLTSIYNSNMNSSELGSNIDGTGTPLTMPTSQFEFVQGLKRNDPSNYASLLQIASNVSGSNLSDDEKRDELNSFFSTFGPLSKS